MKSKTTKHTESVMLSKEDLDRFVENYCGQFIEGEPIRNRSIIQLGYDAQHGVRYHIEFEQNIPDTVKINKQISLEVPNTVLLRIIKENTVTELGLSKRKGIDWKMDAISWNWKNGSAGSDIILHFELEKVYEEDLVTN